MTKLRYSTHARSLRSVPRLTDTAERCFDYCDGQASLLDHWERLENTRAARDRSSSVGDLREAHRRNQLMTRIASSSTVPRADIDGSTIVVQRDRIIFERRSMPGRRWFVRIGQVPAPKA